MKKKEINGDEHADKHVEINAVEMIMAENGCCAVCTTFFFYQNEWMWQMRDDCEF